MLNFKNSKYFEFYFSNKFQFKDCDNGLLTSLRLKLSDVYP